MKQVLKKALLFLASGRIIVFVNTTSDYRYLLDLVVSLFVLDPYDIMQPHGGQMYRKVFFGKETLPRSWFVTFLPDIIQDSLCFAVDKTNHSSDVKKQEGSRISVILLCVNLRQKEWIQFFSGNPIALTFSKC